MHRHLSVRETQILRLVAAGLTTKAIASTLSIAESTVNWHVGNALAKLGAASRAEAVAIMLADGGLRQSVVVLRPTPVGRVRRLVTLAAALAVLLALAGATAIAALRTVEVDRPERPEMDPVPRATATAAVTPHLGGERAPASALPAVPAPSAPGVRPGVPASAVPAPSAAPVTSPAAARTSQPLPAVPVVPAAPLPSAPALGPPVPPLPNALPAIPPVLP